METKQIDVSCPCCNTRLTIDVLSRTILRHAPPEQVDDTGKPVLDPARWAAANERAASSKEAALDKFESALGKEQSREKDLDDLFDKAKRKANRAPEPEEE